VDRRVEEPMAESLFARPLVPVAGRTDAESTLAAALPRIAAAEGRAVVVHVIEKAGGAPDKASVEQRETAAAELFERAEALGAEAGVEIETEVRYGTDVAEAIREAAAERDATAVVFTPRESKWWWNLFGHEVREKLVTESERPVVVLPDVRGTDADASAGGGE
jgi:nucleotide-binding universal stress UspA family protein